MANGYTNEAKAVTYTCKGSVRGECGHTHRTLVGAARCLHRDQRACTSLGGGAYSDRTIVRTDGEEMSELEMYEIDDIKQAAWAS